MATASFYEGDKVEVCSKEEGFVGSYYEATVLSRLNHILYKVEYKNLVEELDQSKPLVEIVSADEVRPLPPKIAGNIVSRGFSYLEKVDAFDNDGWWVGNIAGKTGSKYWVYFETTGDMIAYPVSQLRNHLEWRNNNWVRSKNLKQHIANN